MRAESSGGGTSLGVGPVAVDLPVALPLGAPIAIRVPPPVTPPETPPETLAIPAIPAISDTTLPIPQLPIPQRADPPTSITSAAAAPLATRPPSVPLPTAPASAARVVPTLAPGSAMDAASTAAPAPAPPGAPPGAPMLPSSPWTLAFAGAAALVGAGADTRGAERGGGSQFVAVIDAARDDTARLVAMLVAPRTDPSRPGFALRSSRPG